jgi:hypothetical protein
MRWHRAVTLTGVYDQPSGGRRFGPALIAFLVVLAGAAGALGYFGARSVLSGSGNPSAGGATHSATPPASSTDPRTPNTGGSTVSGGGGGNPSQTKTQGTPTTTVQPGDGSKCPQATVDALNRAGLNSTLTVLLYVQAHRDGETDSEVWVCRNADGVLIYQGHILRAPLTNADDAQNTLLLVTGIKGSVAADGDGFVAKNPNGNTTTEYHVSRTSLVQVDEPNDRNRTEYQVVNVFPH